jgi:hypothetical protein
VFESRCSGVFATYQQYYGLHELSPVRLPHLKTLGPGLVGVELGSVARALAEELGGTATAIHDAESQLHLGSLSLALRPPGGGVAATERVSLHLVAAPSRSEAEARLAEVWERLVAFGGRPVHAPGPDAFAGATTPGIARRLGRLRAAAPLGQLAWTRVLSERGGRRVTVELSHPEAATLSLWLEDDAGTVRGGYQLGSAEPSAAVRAGLSAALKALSATPQ